MQQLLEICLDYQLSSVAVAFRAKQFILFAFAQAVLPSLTAVGGGNDEKPLRQEIPKCRHAVVP